MELFWKRRCKGRKSHKKNKLLIMCPQLSFGIIVVAVRLYENVIVKFMNIEHWSKEINCNIVVKKGCPISPTLFGIYINK
jgi:hypothetical protein